MSMQYSTLPQLGDNVSKICLGTMTWGQQNNEADGHAQMDYALAQGVNFWDTAEMYPSPPDKDKQGTTERIIGSWFAKTGNRNEVILASKISRNDFLRDGNTKFDKATIKPRLMPTYNAYKLTILIFTSYTGLNAKPTFLANVAIPKRWQTKT